MKYQRDSRLFAATLIIMLLALAACSDGTNVVILQSSSASGGAATPVAQQQTLPKGLFKSNYPVIDWIFNRTCSLSVNSYSRSSMDATIAYDSSAWLYPDDGHLVEGFQDCDKNTLLQQARSSRLPTLLTVGIDSS